MPCVIMLNAVYAERHYAKCFTADFSYVYAECFVFFVVPSVIILSVVKLSVVAPFLTNTFSQKKKNQGRESICG